MLDISAAFMTVTNAITTIIKSKASLRSIPKDDMVRMIERNIKMHRSVRKQMGFVSPKDMRAWYDDKVVPEMHNYRDVEDAYDDYVNHLTKASREAERKCPMNALADANDAMADVLSQVVKQMDILYTEEHIDLYNLRMSHVAVLGLLKNSNTLVDFSVYLFTFFVRAASQNAGDIPGYRRKFIVDHAIQVSHLVSDINDKKGNYYFMREAKKMHDTQADVILNASNLPRARMGIYPPFMIENILEALSHLNIFTFLLDSWDDFMITRYERDKETREWLINHVALLRLQLQETDPNSPDYQKLESIIAAYDRKITDYDQSIAEYESRI